MPENEHLPFDAPLAAYEGMASRVLADFAAGGEAYRFFHQHLPRFRRKDVPWIPEPASGETLRAMVFDHGDARLAVARFHDFLDWQSLAEWVSAIESRDPEVYPFECAVEAVIGGDAASLRGLLDNHPGIVTGRSTRLAPFDPPRHAAALLHYVAANGVEGYRQKTPANGVEIAEMLLDAGADPNALAFLYGGECTVMSLLVSSCHPARAGIQARLAELLIDRGARVDDCGRGHWTSPLWTALIFGYADTAEVLARRGAPVDIAEAAGLGRTEEVRRKLCSANAEERHRALVLAAQLGRAGVAEMLLETGEDPNRFNPAGCHSHSTPLHQAALAGHRETVEVLLRYGANPATADRVWSGTAAAWARHGGHEDLAGMLERAAGS